MSQKPSTPRTLNSKSSLRHLRRRKSKRLMRMAIQLKRHQKTQMLQRRKGSSLRCTSGQKLTSWPETCPSASSTPRARPESTSITRCQACSAPVWTNPADCLLTSSSNTPATRLMKIKTRASLSAIGKSFSSSDCAFRKNHIRYNSYKFKFYSKTIYQLSNR